MGKVSTYKVKKKVLDDGSVIDAQGKKWSEKSYAHMRQYQTKYNRSKYRMYCIRFRREIDTEIIEYLNALDSVNEYITDLIKKDLKKKKVI